MRVCLALATVLAFGTGRAWAHTGVGETAGFAHGFMHPVGGLDHVLAMVAVGLFAALLGGRALGLVPLAFVTLMAVGGALGAAGVGLPFVEWGIALSVVALGAAVALRRTMPVAAAVAFVGFFALFHGHAHGAERPDTASGLAYGAGFLLATALLHGAGVILGLAQGFLAEREGLRVVRAAGLGMTLAGLGLLVRVF